MDVRTAGVSGRGRAGDGVRTERTSAPVVRRPAVDRRQSVDQPRPASSQRLHRPDDAAPLAALQARLPATRHRQLSNDPHKRKGACTHNDSTGGSTGLAPRRIGLLL